MDWKNKHFTGEALFNASRELVVNAVQTFVEGSMGWRVATTSEGFEATGYSAWHAAKAKFQIIPSAGGSRVVIELLVERASSTGFMLFDVGGYYNRQIRKWLVGIRWQLHSELASPDPPIQTSAITPSQYSQPQRKDRPASLLNRAVLILSIVWLIFPVMLFFVFPLIGLATGHLYIAGRGSSDITIHGIWARAISAIVLAIDVVVVMKFRRNFRRSRLSSSESR